jgi:dihydrofolate reductase
MGRIIFYAACSLDGMLARDNDDFSWLFPYASPKAYAYEKFIKTIGPIIMGSRTYEVVLKEVKGEWPYKGHPVYVMTRRKGLPIPEGGDVTFVKDGWDKLAAKVRKHRKHAWHVGGGRSLAPFLNLGQVDEIQLFVFPLVLGGGKPVFTDLQGETTWKLVDSKADKSGVVALIYRKASAAEVARLAKKTAAIAAKTLNNPKAPAKPRKPVTKPRK